MDIDPRRLVDLLRIAEHGSYSRAAAARNVSQPALSNSISILEKRLGVRLLNRNQRGATLTAFGESLVTYARALETVLARAGEDIELKKLGVEGALAIGVTPVAAVGLVPEAIARLKREAPRIVVTILEEFDRSLLARLRTGEIDLMIGPIASDLALDDIEEKMLLPDPFVLIMRRQHPLAGRKALALRQLREASWIMPDVGTTTRRQIEALFVMADVPWPSNSILSNSATAIKEIVMRTDCVSIMSNQLVTSEQKTGRIAGVRLKDNLPPRVIGVRQRRNAELSPLARRFLAVLDRVAADFKKQR